MEKPKRATMQVTARDAGNGSIEVTIPKNILPRLRIAHGTELELEVEDKKYGPMISLWNYSAQIEEYNKQNKE
jgi:antitoxin component of MazEF toxin-antitoxin module